MYSWKCPYCGFDKYWFDRTSFVWKDPHTGEIFEDGMHYRCERCGKNVDYTFIYQKTIDPN